MADITVSFTDGTSHIYENAPDTLTRDDVLKRVLSDFPNKVPENLSRESYKEMGALDVAAKAVKNLPSSTMNVLGDVVSAVTSPIQTGKAVLDIAAGSLQNLLPEAVVQAIGEDKASRQAASAVAKMYADKYGSVEGFKRAVATDPAGFMADVSTVLSGGSLAAAKAPQAAGALSKAASMVDPLSLAAKGVVGGAKLAGRTAEEVLGLSTGAGAAPIYQAYKAGVEGGDRAKQFTSNLRGTADMMDVLDAAKQNLEQLRANRSAAYKANMANIKGDKTVLDFSGIDNAVDSAMSSAYYKGQIKNQDAANKIAEAKAIIENWKKLDPVEYHTPEGIDALKQSIGQILEGLQPRTASDAAIKSIYNSIKTEITNQAPTYAKTMKAYSDSTDLIKQVEKALSIGDKASADTAMRKLQSLMRNNVNTNYGQRLNLAKALEQEGGHQMMPALAGQALSTWTPRGLQSATAIPAAWMSGGVTLPFQSPRLMGEAAYGAGRTVKGLLDVRNAMPDVDYPTMMNMLYQAEQMKQ